MKKSELIVGRHIVKYRHGGIGLLINGIDKHYFSDLNTCHSSPDNLDENLMSTSNYAGCHEYDIMEIGCITGTTGIFKGIEWIWKRNEYPKIGYTISVETSEGKNLIEGKVVAIDKNKDRIYYEVTKVIRQANSELFLEVGDIKYVGPKGRPRETMVII